MEKGRGYRVNDGPIGSCKLVRARYKEEWMNNKM
jgi:hypothetical protein